MTYPIAFGGGATDYKTRGIPHSWLVGPNGKIVWKGHPGGLNNSIIEKHIVGARIGPKIAIPTEMPKAAKYVKAGQFGKAHAELGKQAKRAKDADLEKSAHEAMASIEEFAKEQLEAIADYKEKRQYEAGLQALQRGAQSFKGMPVAKDFEKELKVWKKDKSIQAELSGAQMLAEARDLVKRGKYEEAAKLYAGIVKSKKFAGTEAQREAEIRLGEIQKYL